MRQKRLSRFAPDHFDTIIIDEAHHAVSGSYTAILDYFSAARVLGVTATPDRGDMRNLGQIFASLAYEYTLPQAIRDARDAGVDAFIAADLGVVELCKKYAPDTDIHFSTQAGVANYAAATAAYLEKGGYHVTLSHRDLALANVRTS